LPEVISDLPANKQILVYDSTGKKGHQALRMLLGAGRTNVLNVSGGFASLSGYVNALTPVNFRLVLPAPEPKRIGDISHADKQSASSAAPEEKKKETNETLVVDVRTTEEFSYGAYPGAVNIPLDELEMRMGELGGTDRKIILYCASGSRSSYALKILKAFGFVNLENGGGLNRMMSRAKGTI